MNSDIRIITEELKVDDAVVCRMFGPTARTAGYFVSPIQEEGDILVPLHQLSGVIKRTYERTNHDASVSRFIAMSRPRDLRVRIRGAHASIVSKAL